MYGIVLLTWCIKYSDKIWEFINLFNGHIWLMTYSMHCEDCPEGGRITLLFTLERLKNIRRFFLITNIWRAHCACFIFDVFLSVILMFSCTAQTCRNRNVFFFVFNYIFLWYSVYYMSVNLEPCHLINNASQSSITHTHTRTPHTHRHTHTPTHVFTHTHANAQRHTHTHTHTHTQNQDIAFMEHS